MVRPTNCGLRFFSSSIAMPKSVSAASDAASIEEILRVFGVQVTCIDRGQGMLAIEQADFFLCSCDHSLEFLRRHVGFRINPVMGRWPIPWPRQKHDSQGREAQWVFGLLPHAIAVADQDQ